MDIYVAAVLIYLAFLGSIAVYKMRSVKTQDDFMVAGRKTTALYLAGTLVCTWVGSGTLFGGAGLAFRVGLSELWFSAGAWTGICIIYFLAHRVRRISEYTMSDILEKRYNAAARIMGTTAVIVAYMTIAGYQFRGAGRLLNILTGIDPMWGGAIPCGVVILFTVVAGLVSIIRIDLFNGIMMVLGVLIALPLAIGAIGTEQVATLPAEQFEVFGGHNWVDRKSTRLNSSHGYISYAV